MFWATTRFAAVILMAWVVPFSIAAQSTDPNFPTSISTNEINGTIRARDVGDPRLTTYYYIFDGGQGDIFINVVTHNFSGDLDVFAAEGLRPLTKITTFADGNTNETGRLVYLRKPERLMLRIQGRSPNDDPATFRIKFAGSFVALAKGKEEEGPRLTQSENSNGSGVRVNSVGTIVTVIPKPTPPQKNVDTIAKSDRPRTSKEKNPTPKPEPFPKATVPAEISETTKVENKKEIAVVPAKTVRPRKPASGQRTVLNKPAKPKANHTAAKPAAKALPTVAAKPDPLASIRLMVQLKDGKVIEHPMSEVLKFSVDQGVLTVIAKDGSIVRYSILDVAKVTIE